MTISPLKQPTAVLPVTMSLAALLLVLLHIVRFGIAPEADEGPTAHLWQLLMAGQVPLVLFYAVTQLPKAPKTALRTLSVQAGAALAALAPVYYLGW